MNLKLFASLQGYKSEWLRPDVIAGLTLWAVMVPEALAYAGIAGVSPVVGLYAAPPALLFYAMLGSSRHLVVGPMSATAALSAGIVATYAAGGGDYAAMTATLAIAAGVAGIAAGLMRLGFVSNLISAPVLKGFIIGLALTIISGQLAALFGVDTAGDNFFEKVWNVIDHLGDTNGWSLLVATCAAAIIFTMRRKAPKLPASLVAVLFGIAAVSIFGLDNHGVDIVGPIDSSLPPIGFPGGASFHDLLNLLPASIGVLLVGYVEGLGAANVYAQRHGYDVNPSTELLALGGSNLAAGLCGGMVVNGSLSKTAVNGDAGANSQLSGLVSGVMTILTLLLLTGLFEQLPESVLAVVVIVAVMELVDIEPLKGYYRQVRTGDTPGVPWAIVNADFLAGAAALMGVLLFDTLPGLFIGILVSIVLLLLRISTPRVAVMGRVPGSKQFADIRDHTENSSVPGIIVLRPEGGMFFANADHIESEVRRLARENSAHTVILDVEAMPFIDVTAAQGLQLLATHLERDSRTLVLAHPDGQVRDSLHAWGNGTALPSYASIAEAVEALAPAAPPAPGRRRGNGLLRHPRPSLQGTSASIDSAPQEKAPAPR